MTISFSRIGVVNNAPQCRIHGKIGHFGPFDNNFSPPDAKFGKSPGSLGPQPQHAVRPPQALHPGLNLNNWAKNFPPKDEVILFSIHTYFWRHLSCFHVWGCWKSIFRTFGQNSFQDVLLLFQISGKGDLDGDDTPEGFSPLSSPISQVGQWFILVS